MFLHLGGDAIVTKKDIVAILDIESAANANATKEFLDISNSQIIKICEQGREKSLVITQNHIYISPISSYTLMKRANNDNLAISID